MSDVLPLHPFDPAAEAAAIRERSTAALRALHNLSLGADPIPALSIVRSLRSRCDHLCHQLSLRILREAVSPSEVIEQQIDGVLMNYVMAGTPPNQISRYGVTAR